MDKILSVLVSGGIVMVPLAICSVLALAIIIEKFIVLRKSKLLNPEIISVIKNLSHPEDIPLALNVTSNYKAPLSQLVSIILENARQPVDDIKEDVSDQGRQEIRFLERGLGILETVAAIAPILGLLGTVFGMIDVFATISQMGVGDAASLSSGISEALVSTAFGLSIGIPTLVLYNYFSRRAHDLILDMENLCNELIRKVRKFKLAA
ncbi:MAG: MotA/TolQ/ExbB proton channel family protein [Candidatus Cloacimonetes bacterium]|nr:MotA/TolQ/ExbB proton channel family protein [Candidatus Cloacimonadota bacterium]